MKKCISLLAAAVLTLSLLTGCTGVPAESDNRITVYLWNSSLLYDYAPYVQAQVPDVDIEWIVGVNDLDFYNYLNRYGELPDIITCRRFSLFDTAGFSDNLLDLNGTETAASFYQTYLENYREENGVLNWLPACGEADGFIANRALFEKYDIPVPTDYAGFVSACREFEKHGIRGFVSDFCYDYTCLEVLQGNSIPELVSLEGKLWRQKYELDPDVITLDDVIWPGIFEKMEQFIEDTGLQPEDIQLDFDPVKEMFLNEEAAVIRGTGADVLSCMEEGMEDPVMLPYFGETEEDNWILTYPAFQIALNGELEKDAEKKAQALDVLDAMLSGEGQNLISQGHSAISYSRNAELEIAGQLDNLKPFIQKNHLYIRLASNSFFSVSKEVVQKMICREYDAEEAWKVFTRELSEKESDDETAAVIKKTVPLDWNDNFGNQAASSVANTLRRSSGADILMIPSYGVSTPLFAGKLTARQAAYQVQPFRMLCRELTGAEIRQLIQTAVEGTDPGLAYVPANKYGLPVFSGCAADVVRTDEGMKLEDITVGGKPLDDSQVYCFICGDAPDAQETLLNTVFGEGGVSSFQVMDSNTRDVWTAWISSGNQPVEPSAYIRYRE
ncbi:MAG: 5'-nucleotidase C-terminal domain-containing protein [Emergencia sp.]